MPRKRVSVKDQARRELAERLRLPLTAILDREEAAELLGSKNKTSLSNKGANGPGFYKKQWSAESGYTLYRRDWLVQYDKWHRKVPNAVAPPLGQQPWPSPRQSAPYAGTEEFLDKLVTGDDDYKDNVRHGWE